MELNNRKISLVTHPECFTIYLYIICEIHIIYKKKRKLWSSFFSEFWFSGNAENEIYAFWFQNGWKMALAMIMRPKCST